jgi:hypothetical protein
MTGGARGRCNPAAAGQIPYYGRGFGYGRGLGLKRGFRGGYGRGYGGRYGWYPAPVAPIYPVEPAEEMEMLKAEANNLQKLLETVSKRIEELEKEPTEKS